MSLTQIASLRQIAKELGIAPAYLSMMVNGKRPWREDLYQRYSYFVNPFVNTVNNSARQTDTKLGVPGEGVEPTLPFGKRILSSKVKVRQIQTDATPS